MIMLGHAAITELQHKCACVCIRYAWISYVHVFTHVHSKNTVSLYQDAVEEILMAMFRDKIKVKQVNVLLLI